ncbi:FkbM family methyltransferase [Nocardiopsis sp. MG754419]|uniref:FkbM family methyltransferase n=1 Tax=Nocardiopsis sp. MG754419 TaxID=2259865 RepID=UPI001BA4B316|nr:FkbM family methyltransferase [Nocardiopsis sp. MG754419]MBR8742968.1 FkbM family methyltransferase [Nocardiopsis sp. MG754419]
MVHDQLRALVRRYPIVRFATRRIRVRLPRRLGGLDPSRVPPRHRHFSLRLPRVAGDRRGIGPDRVELRLPGDLTVPRRLAARGLGHHEPDSIACFLATLDHTPPGAVLDVGSGVGVYAMLAAARSHRPVFAFEPAPELASAARSVSSSARLGFTVVDLALTNHTGTALLHRALHNDMCNRLVRNVRPGLHHVTVRATTLARWNETAGTRPSVVKVDTAGSESDVVAGGLEVLRRHRPWVLVKVRPDRGVEERLMALMEPLDYRWFPISGDPPYEARTEISGRASPAWERMWLLTPEDPPAEFWRSLEEWRAALRVCRVAANAPEDT